MKKEIEIKFKIAGILARPEINLKDRSKKLTDIYEIIEQQLILSGVSQQRELLKGYNEYLDDYIDTHYLDDNMIENYINTL